MIYGQISFDDLMQENRAKEAAIKMLREIEWCNGCKNFRGLQGCRIGVLVTCNPQNDMYVFGEGEE